MPLGQGSSRIDPGCPHPAPTFVCRDARGEPPEDRDRTARAGLFAELLTSGEPQLVADGESEVRLGLCSISMSQ